METISDSQATAIMDPATPPLFRLPAEIRTKIYRELLAPEDADDNVFFLSKASMEPAILSVNHQLRAECSGIFYGNNKLQFEDPEVCIRRLTSLDPKLRDLILELRYDTAEIAVSAATWRTAFRELPGLDEDTKLESLRSELEKNGVRLRSGVLKAKIVISCRVEWKSDPLQTVWNAVRDGIMVARVMFI